MKKNSIDLNGKTVLVTGSPGFIGANLVMRLLKENEAGRVISYDCMNSYYDPKLKEYRLKLIEEAAASSRTEHVFVKGALEDGEKLDEVFNKYRPSVVVNLAAQAGVRYSIEHPEVYIESNIVGFFNVLEACRRYPVEHLVYASSSSVYGEDADIPFSTDSKCDRPVSLYAATKKSGELIAHSYAKLYDIPMTGLRFFTVYGPAGRPDMFYYSAAEKLKNGGKIRLFNYGNCKRDFTFVGDTVEGVMRMMRLPPERMRGEDGLPVPPHAVYNIGAGRPADLMVFIRVLHEELIRAGVIGAGDRLEDHIELVGMQPGDVPVTWADCSPLERDAGFTPRTDVRDGLRSFAEWFAEYER
ncbi:MAG: NAD-dependent epimerase/dehydratase family protein [Clostridia bacterium]|nr:NAD-dependent epimerase/dehydratase family protein [Clostridia bacterium]